MNMVDRYKLLDKEKIDITFKVAVVTILTLIFANNISMFFSVWDLHRKIQTGVISTVSGLIILAVIVFVKIKVNNFKVLNRLYFILIIIVLTMLILMTRDRGMISVMSYFTPIILMLYINVNRKYASIIFGIYLIVNTCFLIFMPIVNVKTGVGIYIINYSIIFVSSYISWKGIDIFLNYEKMLHKEIERISESNKKTMDLYEKISDLNLFNNKIIESFTRVNDSLEEGIIDFGITFNRVYASSRTMELLKEDINSVEEFFEKMSKNIKKENLLAFKEIWEKLYQYDNKSYILETEYTVGEVTRVLKLLFLSYLSYEDESEHIIVVTKDITEEYYKSKKIYKTAYEDILTGLLNRASFIEAIDSERTEENAKNIFVYIVDIDNFKYYNNTFGYEFGDKILISVANKFKELSNINIKAIARLSGDGFAFLSIEKFEGYEFLNLMQEILSHFVIDEIDIKLNCSIGMASNINIKETSVRILENAEIAMYRAKDKGKRNYVEYLSSHQEDIKNKMTLINAMEKGLEKNEFSLNFQPQYDARTKSVVGYESLIRWNSSELGWVSPLDFIPLAEKMGYIHTIGEFVIRESCKFAKKLSEKLIVSINVSGVQLLNDGFFDFFINIIEEIGVKTNNLAIEITETAIIENKEVASTQLDLFRKKGIKVYLDDFGTGYSSLNYLIELPIDAIKIDKFFIDHILKEDREYNVVKMIISLATSFGLKTVAEGVETLEQSEMLEKIGCDFIQGFYYSRPLELKDAIKLVV